MMKIFELVVIAFILMRFSEGGVKIDISRVKESPKTTIAPPDGDANVTVIKETTISTTTSSNPLVTEIATPVIITTAATTLSTTTTTVASLISNETQVANNISISNKMAHPNVTIVPLLPEFTKRQLRRKFTSESYYCPCDLKVIKLLRPLI